MSAMFARILVANRGEIACRVIAAARQLGVATVAVHSDADRDALHPGYGFLAENAALADACAAAGVAFIGPPAEAIRAMGDKLAARRAASRLGIPVNEGSSGDPGALLGEARALPFPLLVKAAAGGGGKGMRIVRDPADLPDAIASTSREAANYFGDGTIYVERYIERPRHVEVQVFGDRHGRVVHFGERECTIQRRHQKILEEAPSPTLTPELSGVICADALRLCRDIGYVNAGTVEFLLAPDGRHYFLEMNTRIQVEHPVTELVTGVDLVQLQIRVAAGEPLPAGEPPAPRGHAIECRLYAEDPARGFAPSPGNVRLFRPPAGPGIRFDAALDGPGIVPPFYDPLIGKLVVHGATRDEARRRAILALESCAIHGIVTNVPYLRHLLAHPDYIDNRVSTGFCEEHGAAILAAAAAARRAVDGDALLAAALLASRGERAPAGGAAPERPDVWRAIGGWRIG